MSDRYPSSNNYQRNRRGSRSNDTREVPSSSDQNNEKASLDQQGERRQQRRGNQRDRDNSYADPNPHNQRSQAQITRNPSNQNQDRRSVQQEPNGHSTTPNITPPVLNTSSTTSSTVTNQPSSASVGDDEESRIVGTLQTMEKPYYRLTGVNSSYSNNNENPSWLCIPTHSH